MILEGPAFLSLSFGEMLVVAVVALLVFGGKLPEVMRNLGRAYAKFRHGVNDISRPLRQEMHRLDVTTPPRSVRTSEGEASGPLYDAGRHPGSVSPDERPPAKDALPRPPGVSPGGAADEPPPV